MSFFLRNKKHNGWVTLFVALSTLVLLAGIVYAVTSTDTTAPSQDDLVIVQEKPEPNQPQEFTLLFVGDMMFDRGVETSVKNNFNSNFEGLFEHTDFLQQADLVFGNLEGPVSDKGRNVGSKWSFRMDPAVLPVLKQAGFSIVSFANNHVGDWSQAAFNDTLERLESNDILYTGAGWNKAQAQQPAIIELGDTTIGFLGFTDVGPNWMEAKTETPGILLASDPNFSDIITRADEQVDMLVTSFHWGAEYVPYNSRQESLAQRAIDAGADLVIGHHPHVIQAVEYYRDIPIAYSLGNFIFDQYFSNETMQGMVLEVTLKEGIITDVTQHITELDRRYQPQEPRPVEAGDIVQQRVSTSSLCPTVSSAFGNKWLYPVSPDNGLGAYTPPAVTHMNNRIDARGTATCLTPETADALEKMFNDSRAAGMKLVMTSGYRTADVQRILYNNYITENPNDPNPLVAKPGHSEHQLGTTVDFRSLSTPEFTYAAFGGSPEYVWLTQNAHRYGFVQSYPAGKESVTGYAAESWHWRYVGVERAQAVRESGLTLYEYLSQNTVY